MNNNLIEEQSKEKSTIDLKLKWKKDREKRRDYLLKYHKYYYFKNLLKDKDYNKKIWENRKIKKLKNKENK